MPRSDSGVDPLISFMTNVTNDNSTVKPKLIVFDLDLTLWICAGTWIDTCSGPPFTRKNNNNNNNNKNIKKQSKESNDNDDEDIVALDRDGCECHVYKGVTRMLRILKEGGFKLAVASRTQEPSWAFELMKVIEIDHYFDLKQIYPGSKLAHFRKFHEATNIDYTDMLFFDDESRNINEISRLGVTSICVKNGMNDALLMVGFKKFAENYNNNNNNKMR